MQYFTYYTFLHLERLVDPSTVNSWAVDWKMVEDTGHLAAREGAQRKTT